MRLTRIVVAGLAIAKCVTLCGACGPDQQGFTLEPIHCLPSRLLSGDTVDDTIHFNYYRPKGAAIVPAIVLVPGLDARGHRGNQNEITDPFAKYLAARGWAAVAIDLPFHQRRLRPGDNPTNHFLSSDPNEIVRSVEQSVSDVSTVAAWLRSLPGIDPHKVGVIGISLGATVVHIAMGQDPTLNAGVAILGIGNVPKFFEHSAFYHMFHPRTKLDSPEDKAKLARIDPITYACQNSGRHILMIQAARDFIFPPHYATDLWRALGQPPITWMDTNHLGPAIAPQSAWRASRDYLANVWLGKSPSHVGDISVPTVRAGVITEWHAPPALTVQYQLFPIGRRPDHMSLLSTNVGYGTRGAFANVGATLSPYLDVGYILHPSGSTHLYISLHIVL